MASAHHARGRSRNRSGDRTAAAFEQNTHSIDSTPKAGTKRLFSNRESRQPTASENAEFNPSADGGERHSDKRHRSSDWPLPNPSPSSVSSVRHHLHNRKSPNSPSGSSHRSRPRSLVRPSKFLEGSMNDRVSQMPPVPYLEPEDEFLSEHNTSGCGEGGRGRNFTRSRIFTHHPNTSITESSTSQSDASRSSSIFRFGKSIAASFNPSNWKFWGKEHEQQEDEGEDEEVAQLRVLQERQAKAERIYQELKESGHFRDSALGPRLFTPASEKKAGKHDSGIEFGELDLSSSRGGSMSMEEKRMGRVFLEPPRHSQSGESPGSNYEASVAQSNTSTPRKFTFKKPSLANLKKASLSNIKSAFAGDSILSVNDHHQARRIPSRKDLHKQQKLVKRVSNLEERLKQARQQLSVALNEPMPVGSPASQAGSRVSRSRFVPGAMSSLPSERLLSGYVSSEAGFSDDEMDHGIGQAVSTDHYMSGGLSEQSKDITSGSTDRREDKQENDVMQSVEDAKPAHLTLTPASFGDASQAADLTPKKLEDTELAEYEDEELTPKPKAKNFGIVKPSKSLSPVEGSKKRKSIFERIPDDGGDYNPSEAEEEEEEENDLESDIISEVSSLTRPTTIKTKSTSVSTSKTSQSRGKGPTLILQPPRKQQKTAQGLKNAKTSVPKPSSAKSASVGSSSSSMPPPTRTAPPPPPPTSKPTFKKLAPHQLKRMGPLPSQPQRQQSASPPPSSTSFSSPGSRLVYNKPTRTHKLTPGPASKPASRIHEEENGFEVPPMPPMPKAVRLASGEILKTEGMVKKVAAAILGDGGNGDGDGKREGAGMSASASKQSFEWPDDVF